MQIKTVSMLKEIITSGNEVIKDYESGMAVEIRQLVDPTRETAENNVIAKLTVGS
jgi:hypothetical protein